MNCRFLRWLVPLLAVVLLETASYAKQIAVIVDKANTTGNMTVADLAKLLKFDGRNKWADGRNIVIVVRESSSPEMQTALQKLYKMQVPEFNALIAAHRGSVMVVKSEEELLKTVESLPGAIGFVDVYSINNKINVLKVDGKLPLEPGYLLKGN
ncbi:MAG TPA: substrate-binding domain-containing protein [Candidatus Angelobacter sp.]|nr:substrate-binding domain-containing protein [Candidatus Angelobacter sp.]